MTKYHVGCGAFGIYAGTRAKPDKDGWQSWHNKSDVTSEAIASVAEYLLKTVTIFKFTYNGKRYLLSVKEVEDA